MSTTKLTAALAVTAAIGLGALAPAAPAQASTGQTKHVLNAVRATTSDSGKTAGSALAATSAAKPSGYVVVNSGPLASPAGVQAHGSATCPSGKVPFGGGVFISSGSTAANINSSYPTAAGWNGDVNNASGAATTFTVYAVCGKKPKKYVQVTGNVATVTPGAQTSVTATCSAGKPLGGGFFSNTTSTAANANSSIPTTNGWRADANNASGASELVTAYVVCGKVGNYAQHVGTSVPNGAGAQTAAAVLCGGQAVPVGGGGFSSSGSTAVSMNSTYPIAGGWQTYENNATASPATVTSYVVCSG